MFIINVLKYKIFIYLFIYCCIKNGINNHNNAIKEVRELFNEIRSNLSREESKRIRDKLNKKEPVYNILMEKDSLTNKEKELLKNIDRYLKNISMHLKN